MGDSMVETVKTDSFEMDYIRFGAGKRTMVIIPGLSLKSTLRSEKSIEAAYESLTETFTIYLFDRRKEFDASYSLIQMARDTAEAIRAAGLTRICLFGTSQGGMICQYIAIENPDLVEKMVLGSSACRISDSRVASEWLEFAENGKSEELICSFIDNCYSRPVPAEYKAPLIAFFGEVTQDELRRFTIQLRALKGFDIYDGLSKIKCPVLVIGSWQDKVLPPESSVDIARKLSCDLFMYSGYGHAVYDEAPDYKKKLLDFLK